MFIPARPVRRALRGTFSVEPVPIKSERYSIVGKYMPLKRRTS